MGSDTFAFLSLSFSLFFSLFLSRRVINIIAELIKESLCRKNSTFPTRDAQEIPGSGLVLDSVWHYSQLLLLLNSVDMWGRFQMTQTRQAVEASWRNLSLRL